MKKIIVVGNNGVGKSVFSKKLSKIVGVPVVHLDEHFHRNDGSRLGRLEWDKKHLKLIKGNSWVMDGTYPRTLDIRLKKADTIIFLDYPKLLAFYSAVKRRMMRREKTRLFSRKSYFRLLKKILIISTNCRLNLQPLNFFPLLLD